MSFRMVVRYVLADRLKNQDDNNQIISAVNSTVAGLIRKETMSIKIASTRVMV